MLLLLSGAYRSYKTIFETISLRVQDQNNAIKLKDSQARLSLHVQQTPLAVIEMDTDMNITQWNNAASKIFGFNPSETIGKSIIELVVPESARAAVANVVTSLHNLHGGTHSINENVTKSGEIILCEWFNTPLIGDDGNVIGIASLAQDITERQRTETMKNEFISIVSHELRTPLTSMKGSLGLVLGGATGELSDKTRQFLSMADQNAERLSLLISDILDIQSIESGTLSYRQEVFDLRSVIQLSLEQNRHHIQQSGIAVVPPELPHPLMTYIDPSRIQQVLDNLLSNAIKFSPPDGTITISADSNNSQVTVSIKDEGEGVPDEFIPHLFEKFTQGEASNTRNFSGTGLGLSIAKGIIEHHGGKIFYSRPASEGSQFNFELPLINKS
ncbi:MAG: PAS domain S-box protein [Gammaproteobacteria bacterium]|nr:PAS domain S-box protein [Gammaproteobacteria bacterium]